MLPIVQTPEGLTAREIFNKIIKGQAVRIPDDLVLAKQLQAHLNVIKSREKKLFASLGLDFVSSVISVEISPHPDDFYYEIKMVAPKQRRRYPVFLIEPDVSTG